MIHDKPKALARAAYDLGDAPALRKAELILNRLHLKSSFAVPVQEGDGEVWGALARAKLAAELRRCGRVPAMTHAELAKRLKAAVAESERRDHPLLDVMLAAKGPRGVALYSKNWFNSTLGFGQQLLALAQRVDGEAQRLVLRNVHEEFSDGVPHAEKRAAWMRRLRLPCDQARARRDPDFLVESFALQSFRSVLCALDDPFFALGAFYSIEANFPGVCRRMYAGLRRKGFTEASVAHFKSHVALDAAHAADWLAAVRAAAGSPARRARVLRGALMQLEVRRRMFDAMRRRLAGR